MMDYIYNPGLLESTLKGCRFPRPAVKRLRPSSPTLAAGMGEPAAPSRKVDPIALIEEFYKLGLTKPAEQKTQNNKPGEEANGSDELYQAKAAIRFRELSWKVVSMVGIDLPLLEQRLAEPIQRAVLSEIRQVEILDKKSDGKTSLGAAQYHRWIIRQGVSYSPDTELVKQQSTAKAASAEQLKITLKELEETDNVPMYPNSVHKVQSTHARAQIMFDLGKYFFSNGKCQDAQKYFREASNLVSKNHGAYQDAGIDLFSAEDIKGFNAACSLAVGEFLTDSDRITAECSLVAELWNSLQVDVNRAVELVVSDNLKRQIPLQLRKGVIDSGIATSTTVSSYDKWRLCAANTIYSFVNGMVGISESFWDFDQTPQAIEFICTMCEAMYSELLSAIATEGEEIEIEAKSRDATLLENFYMLLHHRLAATPNSECISLERRFSPQLFGTVLQFVEEQKSSFDQNGRNILRGSSEAMSHFQNICSTNGLESTSIIQIRKLRISGSITSRIAIIKLGNTSPFSDHENQRIWQEETVLALCDLAINGHASDSELMKLNSLISQMDSPIGPILDNVLAYLLHTDRLKEPEVKQLIVKWKSLVGRSLGVAVDFFTDLIGACERLLTATSDAKAQFITSDDVLAEFCKKVATLGVTQAPKRDREGKLINYTTWNSLLGILRLTVNKKLLATLASAVTVAHNCVQVDESTRLSVSRYGMCTEIFKPDALALFKPIAKTLVTQNNRAGKDLQSSMYFDMLRDILDIGLINDPHNPAYYLGIASLSFLQENYIDYLRHCLTAIGMVSCYFQNFIPAQYVTEKTLEKLCRSLKATGAYLQAAAVCQHMRPIDYNSALEILAMAPNNVANHQPTFVDAYLKYLYDPVLLESLLDQYAGNKHYEAEIITLLGRQSFNESTEVKVRLVAISSSFQELLSALANDYGL